jgi:hypothetical protein
MCPDKKLKWFKDHGRTAAQVAEIKKLVIKRWDESYKPTAASEPINAAVPVAFGSKVCYISNTL